MGASDERKPENRRMHAKGACCDDLSATRPAMEVNLPSQKSARHHGHHHGHHHEHSISRNIGIALLLNLAFAVIEFVGGIWTGSVAILSDAVHDFGDTLSLGMAYFMERKAEGKSSAAYSYGLRRMSLLSALITSTFLIIASIWVMIQAIPRLLNPIQPKAEGMVLLAILGIAVNGYAAWRVQKGKTMNERVVSWHLLEDLLGWVAVLIGSIVMYFADLPILDPILSIGFTIFILIGVARSLRSTLHLFLQGVPEGVDIVAFRRDIEALEGVASTHDTHLWSLDGEQHVLTLHVVMRSDFVFSDAEKVKTAIRQLAAERGRIHVTIEMESDGERCPDLNCT
jgi:cobalt-zinc-cadmium efflux system protein